MTTRFGNGHIHMSQTMRPPAAERGNKVMNRILFALLILGIVASAVFMGLVVYWRTEIDKMQQYVSKLDESIECEQRLIENHRNKKEELCSFRNIDQKVRDYKLGLRPTECNQTVYVKKGEVKPAILASVSFPNERQDEQIVLADAKKVTPVIASERKTIAKSTKTGPQPKTVATAKNIKGSQKVVAKQRTANYSKQNRKQGKSYAVYHQ